jgi:hypothetical protein
METLANIGISWSLWVTCAFWFLLVGMNWRVRDLNPVKLVFFIFAPAPVILLDFLLGK